MSRPAVREALERPAPPAWSKSARATPPGCVTSSARRTGPVPRFLIRDGELDVSVVRSMLETGSTTVRKSPSWPPDAERRSSPRCSTKRCSSWRRTGPGRAATPPLTFSDHVVDGADSIAFRLMYNTLRATYEPALPALASMMADEVGRSDAYRKLAEAITSGDPRRDRQPRGSTMTTATARTARKGFTLSMPGANSGSISPRG